MKLCRNINDENYTPAEGGAFADQSSASGNSHMGVTGDQGGSAGKLISISKAKRGTRRSSPSCGHGVLVTGSLPLSVPCPLPCSLITMTKAPAAPFPSGHRSQAVPRARPCPQWVSPVPAPCPQCQPRVLPAPLAQSPPLLLLGWEGAFFGLCFCHLAFKCNESSRY